jgi:hypothetical protein
MQFRMHDTINNHIRYQGAYQITNYTNSRVSIEVYCSTSSFFDAATRFRFNVEGANYFPPPR